MKWASEMNTSAVTILGKEILTNNFANYNVEYGYWLYSTLLSLHIHQSASTLMEVDDGYS